VTRQVRLDDDVAAFVESRSGGLSLSGATNAVLRSVAAGDSDRGDHDQDSTRSTRIAPGESGPSVAPIDHLSTSGSPGATVVDLVESDGPESTRIVPGERGVADRPIDRADHLDASGATRARRAKREYRRPLCKHPLELRVGLRCGICGSTFRR
jgi:hypothetical protein